MDEHKIMNLIKDIEQNYPVQNWKINNIDMWPVFRIITSLNLLKSKSNSKETHVELKEYPKEIPNLSSLLNNSEEADFLFLSDSLYRLNMDGIWYNRLSDPFYEEVVRQGYKAVNIDFSYQNAGKVPILGNTFAIQNQLIHSRKQGIRKELEVYLPQFESVRKKIIEITKFEDILTNKSLLYIATEMLYWIDIFKEILVKKKVKSVFIVNFYQVISYSLIFSCKELNIPSIDIQHGNQRELLYHKWNYIPYEGYNTLPSYFWVWTKEHAEPIRKWTSISERHHVVVGGNLWLEIWKQKSNKDIQKYNSIVNQLVSEQQINIFITLQPKYALPNWDSNIPEALIQFIRESPKGYKFFVRYHQQMLHNYRDEKIDCESQLKEFILQGKVETQYATSLPLPSILKEMDIHITPFSTCVFEAKEFCIPSITLHQHAKLYFQNEIEDGWVIEAETKAEILKAMNIHLERKKKIISESSNNNMTLLKKNIDEIFLNNNKQSYDGIYSNKEVLFSIYYMDGEYNKIIDSYDDADSYLTTIYLSYSYKEVGDFENEQKYSFLALEKAVQNNLAVQDLDLVYKGFNYLFKGDNLNQEIKRILNCLLINKELLGKLLSRLFKENRYDNIEVLCNNLEVETLDSLYYLGRVLAYKRNFVVAAECLGNYVRMYDYVDDLYITQSNNFFISAMFYLGQIFLELKDKEKAVFYLNKCMDLTDGVHEKARELLGKFTSTK